MEVLSKHRGGLDAIARALLDNETIDGAEVARLVDEAYGSPVHTEGAKSVPHFHEAAITAPVSNGGAAGANGGNGAANGHGTPPRARVRRHRPAPVTVPVAPAPPRGPAPRDRVVAAPGVAPARRPRGRGPGGTRNPLDRSPLATADTRNEPNRVSLRHEGGWWSNSSQSGSRTATWPPSAPPASSWATGPTPRRRSRTPTCGPGASVTPSPPCRASGPGSTGSWSTRATPSCAGRSPTATAAPVTSRWRTSPWAAPTPRRAPSRPRWPGRCSPHCSSSPSRCGCPSSCATTPT